LPQPTPEDVSRAQGNFPGTTLVSLSDARKTYVKTCSGCHALHLPTEFPPQKWPSLVNEMVTVQKVKLSTEQRQQIEEFVIVMSEPKRVAVR
jgi:Dihaem cytochrome c